MKRSRVLLTAGVLIAAAALAVIGVVSASTGQERPLSGSSFDWVTEEGVYDGSECPAVEVHTMGEGNLTHLGTVKIVRVHCFTPPDHPEFEGQVMHDGQYEIVAANGDKIWGTYSGDLQPTVFGENGPIRGIITGPSTIDGGTGRFENATGEYTVVGDYDLVADEGYFEFDGWIKY